MTSKSPATMAEKERAAGKGRTEAQEQLMSANLKHPSPEFILDRTAVAGRRPRFQVEPDEIEALRRYIAEHVEARWLSPALIDEGGREVILDAIRRAIQAGNVVSLQVAGDDAVHFLYQSTVGLGVLEPLLADAEIEQIDVFDWDDIWCQRRGRWFRSDHSFDSAADLWRVTVNIAVRQGRGRSRDLAPETVRIQDLVFGTTPPLRVQVDHTVKTRRPGHTPVSLFIRRGRARNFTFEQLLEMGDFNREVGELLQQIARRQINFAVFGPVGSGKTVILGFMANAMPLMPAIVADDAGDFVCEHPGAHVFIKPAEPYERERESRLDLAAMIRAALRKADVFIAAEIRGYEAGYAVADAPAMRHLAFTTHGETAADGLDRLVNLCQRHGSPFFGLGTDVVRKAVAEAVPVVVEMRRSGETRFVSGVYHCAGWERPGSAGLVRALFASALAAVHAGRERPAAGLLDRAAAMLEAAAAEFERTGGEAGPDGQGRWRLRPLVTSRVQAGRIVWRVHDPDLDALKPLAAGEKLEAAAAATGEMEAAPLHRQGMQAIENRDYSGAVHLLTKAMRLDSDNPAIQQDLALALAVSGRDAPLRPRVEAAMAAVSAASAARDWRQVQELLGRLKRHPGVYALLCRQRDFGATRLRTQARRGLEQVGAAERALRAAGEVLEAPALAWQEADRCLAGLRDVEDSLLPPEMARALDGRRIALLRSILDHPGLPAENRPYFQQALDGIVLAAQGGDDAGFGA
jgi:type IV secretory pathway ATPase VirB11/archaellum biosynthesis ATPase